ncbi:cytosine permease [Agathobaculum sp.]|uniref:cytosine permease n=1 Tax=Agathobaculum sp. TaxID=2048138 RepID=UPI002A7F23F3|nr:cytosine permease [Agathobaculum sp.]MDY3618304.1 cytosine permease [Agathobaculum sp.]
MKENKMESVTLQPVPMDERKSWIDVALIQAGILICVPSLMLGGMLAQSMSMSSAILSGLVGYAIVIVLMIVIGIIGSDLGVPTCVVASGSFGRQGSSKLISALFMISMVGWFAVQNGVCGSAFSNLMSQAFHVNIPVWVSTVVWGIIMLVTAVYGINALDKLNKFAIPALVVVTAIGCVLAIQRFGTGNLWQPVENPTMTFSGGVVLTISFMATGALNAPDFTRFQKTRRDTVLSSSVGVMPAGMAMLVLGAVMTRIAQQYDISLVFVDIGLPVLGMLVLILATWTTNTTNAYSAGLNAVMVFNLAEDKRAVSTVLLGVVGTVLAAVGVAGYFEGFLYLLGDTFMPIVGIFFIDYWIFAKGSSKLYQFREGWRWTGLLSWALGFAATRLPFGISFVNGTVVALVLYLALEGLARKKEPVKSEKA